MANKMDVRSNLAEIFLKSIEEQPLSWNKNFRSAKRPYRRSEGFRPLQHRLGAAARGND